MLPSLRTYLKEMSFLTAPARNWHPKASHRQDADEYKPADLNTRRSLPGEPPRSASHPEAEVGGWSWGIFGGDCDRF